MGHYVGFVDSQGRMLPWLQRVQNFLPNGVHAVVVACELVRMEMFRFEYSYDLLITRHWLNGEEGKRPELRNEILFLGRNGSLDTELWGKDAAFRGGAQPHFYTRSGERGRPADQWSDASFKITEAVCCSGCRHCHLLEARIEESTQEVMA
jgi:hypothetical protein